MRTVSTILLCIFGSPYLFALGVDGAPDWVLNPIMKQECSVGIGSHTSDDPVSQALVVSTLEHAMKRESQMTVSEKLTVSSNIRQELLIANLRSQTSGYTLQPIKEWRNASGDLFILNCQTEDQSQRPFEITLKYVLELSHYESKAVLKRYFDVIVGKQYYVQSEKKDSMQNSMISATHPQWIDGLPGANFAVGTAHIYDRDIATAYLEALVSARIDLAKLKSTASMHKDKPGFTALKQGTKPIASSLLQNSMLHALWIDHKMQTLYVLLHHNSEGIGTQKQKESHLLRQLQSK